jgi:hypothetical protein
MAFTIPTGAFAAEAAETESLPEAGMAPDSPFYFMERWGEQISLAFTFNAEKKVQKALRYAEERLAEAEAMAEQNKVRAMERAANEYQNCLEIATQNMEKTMVKGNNTSEQLTAMMSKHISYMYQHQYQNNNSECEDCQQIRQQIRERAQTCQEEVVEALASQDPEAALQLGVRLMEQARNRVQNMVSQSDNEQIDKALQQCERFQVMTQAMIANAEQLRLGPEAVQMGQQSAATQEDVLNQMRNQYQIGSGDQAETPIQNQIQEQQGGTTTNGGTDNTQGGSGPLGPAPNSGDGIPDGSGFDSPNGANGNTFGRR